MIDRGGAKVFWITEQHVPFAVLRDQWIAFDDDNSLTNKVCCRLARSPTQPCIPPGSPNQMPTLIGRGRGENVTSAE